MRILHILNDVTNRGNGIVNVTVDIAIEQSRQGHTVAIASAGGEYEELLRAFHVEHIYLDQSRTPTNLPLCRFSLFTYRPSLSSGRGACSHAHRTSTGRRMAQTAWLCAGLARAQCA